MVKRFIASKDELMKTLENELIKAMKDYPLKDAEHTWGMTVEYVVYIRDLETEP